MKHLLPAPKNINDTMCIVTAGLPPLKLRKVNEISHTEMRTFYRVEILSDSILYWAGCTYEQYYNGNRLN